MNINVILMNCRHFVDMLNEIKIKYMSTLYCIDD